MGTICFAQQNFLKRMFFQDSWPQFWDKTALNSAEHYKYYVICVHLNIMKMDRKKFLKQNLFLGGTMVLAPGALIAKKSTNQEAVFSGELILEFVLAAHKSFDETKKILEKYPLLLNCTSQFKKGDFETAVGGASHMGRRDIVDYLVSKGARLDIFNYAFLGYDDFIKKIVTDYPYLLNSYGPHGFTLLHHAEVGKRTELVEWFQSKGLTEKMFKGVFE